jgi:transcriptional accessory protein Tex/SPT6
MLYTNQPTLINIEIVKNNNHQQFSSLNKKKQKIKKSITKQNKILVSYLVYQINHFLSIYRI